MLEVGGDQVSNRKVELMVYMGEWSREELG